MFRYTISITALAILLFTACSSNGALPQAAKDLPPGDIARGANLFKQSIDGAPSCSSCHTMDGTALVGPSLQGYGAAAGVRIDGMSAAEYTFQSIVHPASYTVSGFGNLMYNQYAQHLSAQQIADLSAYLLSH